MFEDVRIRGAIVILVIITHLSAVSWLLLLRSSKRCQWSDTKPEHIQPTNLDNVVSKDFRVLMNFEGYISFTDSTKSVNGASYDDNGTGRIQVKYLPLRLRSNEIGYHKHHETLEVDLLCAELWIQIDPDTKLTKEARVYFNHQIDGQYECNLDQFPSLNTGEHYKCDVEKQYKCRESSGTSLVIGRIELEFDGPIDSFGRKRFHKDANYCSGSTSRVDRELISFNLLESDNYLGDGSNSVTDK